MSDQPLSTIAEKIEIEIAELLDNADAERAAAAMDKVKLWQELGRDLKAKLEDALFQFIQASGPLQLGSVRYYIGPKTTVKCRDLGETARTMLELGGPELLRDVLSSSAFKHGAARKRLAELDNAEQYDRLFETVVEQEFKDGKASPKLAVLSFDERFKR